MDAVVHGISESEGTYHFMVCFILAFSSGFIVKYTPNPTGTNAIPLSERCISE